MNRIKIKKRIFLFIVPLSILVLSLVAFRSVDFKTSKSLDIFFTFFRELSIFYVDKTDPEKLVQIGIDAMLESLDPYNEFITEENMETLEFQTTGEYGGMGALIRHAKDYPVVAEVYEGTPAHKAGILAGDIILWIDNICVKGMPVDKVSKLLKGAPKTKLTIFIKRINQPDSLLFDFTREKIHIPSVPFYGIISDGIGYIKLANFTTDCSKEVGNALKDLASKSRLKGLILDLRGNPGGLLIEAVKIVNLFVDKNQMVVYTKGQIKEFDQEYKTTSRPVDTETPLLVLVDRASASASEIVAGALQDIDRAVIMGERTFGKGLVQATRALPYNTQLKITTAKYYIPSGRCIQAVDFTQRNEDGSINVIPDSLISAFNTKNGRTVYDGGGISPDIQHKTSLYSRVSSVLYARNLIFNYATLYRNSHSEISPPEKFKFSDDDYNHFLAFLNSEGFEYQSQTEYQLNEFVKVSKQEGFFAIAKGVIDSLNAIILENKLIELQNYRSEIQGLLEEEIVSRYYYQSGRAKFSLYNDKAIPLASSVLTEGERYYDMLGYTNKRKIGGKEN
jgi:carboxyl-terminal processing protease